jgi:transglutaminase-like putative cysteine protease
MFMGDSGFIKPDAPIVRQQLNEIRGDEEKPHAIVNSLLKWIPRNIKFNLGVSIMMSAPEILEKRIGVCTHHSIVFASFARAAGLPTKMVTGYVNLKADPHRWAVHMWNEVWLGQWVAVDPTRGVFITGPSHIKFAEAPSSRELQGIINRLENNLTLEILDFSR